jgi:GGDEF domain-containing protein
MSFQSRQHVVYASHITAQEHSMVERRTDHATRKRVSEMSPDEMSLALLTDSDSGLPNKRAFDEGPKSLFVAMADINGLKAFNDELGYAAGNGLVCRFAEVLKAVGLDAYRSHHKGDEFLLKGKSYEDLNDKLSRARRKLREQPFAVHALGNRIRAVPGADFCYGIGTTLDEAELHLKRWKSLLKPVRRIFARPPERVYAAALSSALDHFTVAFIDQEHLTFTFETPKSDCSLGFKCEILIEPLNDWKSAEMVMHLQSNDPPLLVSRDAAYTVVKEMYQWVNKKLKSKRKRRMITVVLTN